jgi:hypothetical protein
MSVLQHILKYVFLYWYKQLKRNIIYKNIREIFILYYNIKNELQISTK